MSKLTIEVFNPESPGMRLMVRRGVWGRLFKPKDFATLSEVLAAHCGRERCEEHS